MPGVTMTLFDFLERNGLQTLHDRFVEEDVDMTVLPLMDKDDLKELGLTLGQRKKLLTGLDALNRSKDVTVATDTPSGNPIQLRRLSVLFCDMIGSTELGEQLDIDEMHVVLQHYYDTANIIAQKHGGHVAATQGDGLVLLFGYPRVLDGFAEQCVMAAQDLQTALAEKPVIWLAGKARSSTWGKRPAPSFQQIGIRLVVRFRLCGGQSPSDKQRVEIFTHRALNIRQNTVADT